MIRINLLGEKEDHSLSYALQTLALIASVVVTILICFMVHGNLSSDLESMTTEQSNLKRQLDKLEKVTREIDDLENKKKLLREKLQTIALLKAKKHGPVHILDDINMALPERAWLSSITEKNGALEIYGVAIDNQTVALFMRSLEKYPFFGSGNVDLLQSTELLQDDIKLQQFSILVKLRDALQAQAAQNGVVADAAAPAQPSAEKK